MATMAWRFPLTAKELKTSKVMHVAYGLWPQEKEFKRSEHPMQKRGTAAGFLPMMLLPPLALSDYVVHVLARASARQKRLMWPHDENWFWPGLPLRPGDGRFWFAARRVASHVHAWCSTAQAKHE
jgi:hypothetical protein